MENKIVKVYSTPTCPWCTVAKKYLFDNKIEFEAIDVSIRQDLIEELIEKTGQTGVPVIQIGDEYITGFDKERINELLNIK